MAIQTLSKMPGAFVQGDTVKVLLSFTGYPATEWTLRLGMSCNAKTITPIDATADGTNHSLTINAAASDSITPGKYAYSYIMTETATGERKTVCNGYVMVKPDPTKTMTPTQNQVILEKLKEGMSNLASKTRASVNISGQQFTLRNLKELQETIDRYQVIVDGELRALGLSTAGGAKIIQSVFR